MTDDNEATLLTEFDDRWDHYRKQFKAARRELTEESVHDLRVAARRMLALLGIVQDLDPRARVKKLRSFLKDQLDRLDKLRDAQVMSQEAARRGAEVPGFRAVQAELEHRLEALERKAHKRILRNKPSDLKRWVRKCRTVVKKHTDDPDLLEQLEHTVDEAHAATMRQFALLSADDPDTIHHVRIAFKNFRYMIETIQPLLPGYPADYPDRMHEYQDAMGHVHDMAIFIDTLHELAPDIAGSELDMPAAESSYHEHLQQLIRDYFVRKDEFNMFWRATPDSAFPWEQSNEPVHRPPRNRRRSSRQQHGGAGQPAAADQPGTQEVPQDSSGAERHGDGDRADPHIPVPEGS